VADVFGMQTLLDNPDSVLDALITEQPIFGVLRGEVCLQDGDGVVVELELAPWRPCADADFPNERIRILAKSSRFACVVPQEGDTRRWKHRMPGDLGQLCLWYPKDHAALIWQWDDGLLDLITIAHRHLQYEEYWRRNGSWPVEDVPHGVGKHPVRTSRMETAARRWGR
jgi:hypothetical protein